MRPGANVGEVWWPRARGAYLCAEHGHRPGAVIPAKAGIQVRCPCHSCAGRNPECGAEEPRGDLPEFRMRTQALWCSACPIVSLRGVRLRRTTKQSRGASQPWQAGKTRLSLSLLVRRAEDRIIRSDRRLFLGLLEHVADPRPGHDILRIARVVSYPLPQTGHCHL